MITQHLVTALKADGTINALGTPALNGRIFPNSLPDAPTYPAVMISKVSGVGESTFEGDAGIESCRIQVDVLGLNYAQVVEIKRAIRTFVLQRPPWGPPCVIDSCHCINDTDFPAAAPNGSTEQAGPVKLRRRLMEFRVWYRP